MRETYLPDLSFDGVIGGISKRILATSVEGHKFETPLTKKLKKIRNVVLIALIGVLFTLSLIAITKWLTFDIVYTQGVTDTMRAKNGLKSKITYAGASGEGRIMNTEDKHGR